MRSLTLGLIAAASIAGCDGAKDPTTEPVPTFAEVRDDILLPSCGFSTCHGSGTGGFTLEEATAYETLVDAVSTVAPGEIHVIAGDPDNSYLVKKLEGAAGIVGEPMPPPTGGLAAADLERIRAWIADGAAR